jgi:DNA-directed RNA polymerase specialized sigma24 family protein
VDEEELALRLMDGDREALRTLLVLYGGKVKNFLRKRYGDSLQEQERDLALNTALIKVWRHARSIQLGRGSLGGWFLRIAQRCAIDILNRELGRREDLLALDPEADPVDDCEAADDEVADARVRKRLSDLDAVIEGLGRVQHAIVKADLAAGGQADNARLAAQLGTSLNSIYVSRNKAHEAIRKGMQQRGHFTDRPGGKK